MTRTFTITGGLLATDEARELIERNLVREQLDFHVADRARPFRSRVRVEVYGPDEQVDRFVDWLETALRRRRVRLTLS